MSTASATQAQPTRLIEAGSSTILELKSSKARALFGLNRYVHRSSPATSASLFAIHLWLISGFATEVGDQAEVDFSGTDVEAGYLLSIKGFVNEFLTGFFHFNCELLVRQLPVTAAPDAESIVPLGHNLAGRGGSVSTTKTGFLVEF